jgi:hypothetical protein
VKAEIKEKWLAALRSGEYKQGKGYLKEIDGATGEARYCCLGVLCDLAVKDGLDLPNRNPLRASGKNGVGYQTYGPAFTVLPYEVEEWADMPDVNPRVPLPAARGRATYTLAELNDGNGNLAPRTFEEIADIIEEHL